MGLTARIAIFLDTVHVTELKSPQGIFLVLVSDFVGVELFCSPYRAKLREFKSSDGPMIRVYITVFLYNQTTAALPNASLALSDSDDSSYESVHSERSTAPLIRKSRSKEVDQSKLTSSPCSIETGEKKESQPVVRKKMRKFKPLELSDDDLNPSDVQRIVVEHVIKNDSSTAQSPTKWLRNFSGKVQGEGKQGKGGVFQFQRWRLPVPEVGGVFQFQ
ncbi:uncharacterized protein V6R79_020135, partial [Siganus canaliculatus]